MRTRIKTILIFAIAILMAMPCAAQGDGGKKKKKQLEINNHEYVDLGLQSGLKWATCNIGASSPSDFGSYFAWGETKVKSEYKASNSLTYGKNDSELRILGFIDATGKLTMNNDAARYNWGGSWRMPTKEEMEELCDKCTWTWITQNGHNGYKVTGPSGKSIFLPAAGGHNDKSQFGVNEYGYYCTSSVGDSNFRAINLTFNEDSRNVRWYIRSRGYPIRPVSK